MYRRKDGLWQHKQKINGKWVSFAGKTQNEVVRKIRNAQETAKAADLFRTVADEFESWKFEQLSPGSLSCYRPALRHAVEEFGDRHIVDIKSKDVSRYLSRVASRHAAKTVGNYRTMLLQVFSYAINEMGIDMPNPVLPVKAPAAKIKKEERHPLTPAQRAEVDATRPDEFLLAFLIVHTGARLGEACALQWKDIDFERDIVQIHKSVHWDGNRPYIGRLKTENGFREVPLLSPLRKMLEAQGPHDPEDYIISGKDLLTARQRDNRWTQWCRDHGLATPELKIWTSQRKNIYHCEIDRHQLRHEYATSLFRAGLQPKEVQHLLGHAQISTTMDIYVHWQRDSLENARAKIEAFLTASGEPVVSSSANA